MLVRRTAVTALMSLAVLACSGDSTGPDGDGSGDGVTIESDRAASKIIGPLDSASISATGSSGASYTLNVPRLTVRDSIEYTVTPIRSAGRVLGDAGFVAGVRLGPDGRRLNTPATLMIELPVGTNPNVLAGFVADEDGSNPVLVPVFVRDGKAVLLVSHFSTAGVVQLASNIPDPPNPDPATDAVVRIALHIIARQAAGQAPDADTLAAHLRTWYTGLVKPLLVSAAAVGANDSATIAALAAEKTWSVYLIRLEQEPGMQFQLQTRLFDEMDEVLPLVTNALRAAVVRNNELCLQEADFDDAVRAINNVYYWYKHAFERFINSAPMDRETIDEELCAVTAIDSVAFVSDVEVGANEPLQVRAGLLFEGSTQPIYSLHTQVEVVPVSGASAVAGRPLVGDTDEDGVFVTELRIETSTVVLEVRTSMAPIDVWGEEFVAYNDTTLLVQPVAVDIEPDSTAVAAGGTVQFGATVTGTTNQQVVWTVTQPGGTMSGTGLFTASSTTGTFQVIASSVEEPSAQDTATVTVAAANTGGVAPTFVTTFLSAAASIVVETAAECCAPQTDAQIEQRTDTFDPYSQSFSVDTSRTWPDDPETTNVNESGFASSSSTGTQTTTFERDAASGRVLAIEGSGGGGGSASAGNTGLASSSGQSFVVLNFTVGATGTPFILHATCQTTTSGGDVSILLSGGAGVPLEERCGETAPSRTIDRTLQLGPGNYQFTFERRWGAGADNNQSSSVSASGDFTVRFTQ